MRRILLAIAFSLASCSGSYRLIEKNDAFSSFNKDQEFTQGLEIQYERDRDLYALGQNIYTPRDKKSSGKVKGERPYAGYAYGRYERSERLTSEADWLWGMEAGIVGPSAGGKFSQCTVHGWLGQDCPAGWSNELPDRLLATGTLGVKITRPFELAFTSPTIEHTIRLEAGNKIIGLTTSHLLTWHTRYNFDYYSGPRIYLVGYDHFLDSDPDRRELDVQKNPWFAEFLVGGRVYYKSFSFGLELVLVSPQYEAARGNYGYGQITLEYKIQ